MSIQEIEQAVKQLSPSALQEFKAWFDEFNAEMWDRQIERDAADGRLDKLANEARTDLREGRCTDI